MESRRRRIGEIGYVAVVAACAVIGAWGEIPGFYLAAIALALPTGLLAFVGIYGGYALLAAIGGLFTDTELPDGSTPTWLLASSAIVNVLLISAAAATNVLALQWWRRRKVRRRIDSRLV